MSKFGAALKAAQSDAIPAYINENGQYIAGRVMTMITADGEYGEYPILEIAAAEGNFAIDDDGPNIEPDVGEIYAVHAFRQTAKNQVTRTGVKPGDDIVYVCNGQKASKNAGHNDMFLYKIVKV